MNPLVELANSLKLGDPNSGVATVQEVRGSTLVISLQGVRREISKGVGAYKVGDRIRIASGSAIGLVSSGAQNKIYQV
jgi:hypothetical protein